ncbi:MAG: aspartate aminotransferase family protein [Candidatus Omnitrophica bacterium]|nr:aspartate aminotransferase family protein [Candidatus Omnitrophota bacterium]
MTTQDVISQYERYVMDTYVRQPLVLVKGKGSRVWDLEGHEYLDLFPGWGVSGVGHCHPWVMKALRGQSTKLLHVPNNFYHPLQVKLAKALVERSFDGTVFFANSGAEMVESAIKLVRRWGHTSPRGGGRYEILVMERSFHGRTTGAMSATGQPHYQQGFEPLLPGFICVPFNDLKAVERAITPKTVAIMVEPIQGEGGVRLASAEFLQGIRRLADGHRLLVIYDEIQTGFGRTGSLFAYQQTGIAPDVMLLAKTLAGGFPMGAMIASRAICDVLTPGTHASTFGGSPLACACALAVLEVIKKQALLERVNSLGRVAMERLKALASRCTIIREVRGQGLMIGIELAIDARPLVAACRTKRLLINCTQQTVLRLLPAMTITRAQLDRGLDILEDVLMEHAKLGSREQGVGSRKS